MSGKRIILTAVAFVVLLVVSQSCYDATTLVIDNSPAVTKAVSFNNDLVPIFNKSCALAGCHNTGGKAPDLTATKAYASLTIGNYLNIATPGESTVYLYLTGKKTPQMPMGATANPSNLNALTLAWIKQGAKNN
jgi:hypothetical protein